MTLFLVSFFYYYFGDYMKVYYDLILIVNFIFDFLLLITVGYILKRNTKIKRIILGALIGSISTLFLFYKITNYILFLYKVVLSVLMILVTFGYKNIRFFITNILYLYLSSIVLGGSIYLIDNELSLTNIGLVFINNGYKLSILIVLIVSPIILYLYIRQIKRLKYNYNNYHSVEVYYKKKKYMFSAYLDTGNKLKDPYKKRPIILVYTDKICFSYEKSLLVPYETIDGVGIIKCITADKIVIDKKYIVDNALIGLSEKKFNIDGIDMLLNNETL